MAFSSLLLNPVSVNPTHEQYTLPNTPWKSWDMAFLKTKDNTVLLPKHATRLALLARP